MDKSFSLSGKSGIKLHLVLMVALLFLLGVYNNLNASSIEDSILCQVEYYRAVDSFDRYYGTLEILDEFYKETENYEFISNANKYYNLLPSNRLDSIILRQYLLYHAFYLKKYAGLIKQSTDFYLRAHKLAVDLTNLDKNAWYIEKTLANNYARLNDFDKAIYFNSILIPWLENQNKFDDLSRLYSDLGDNYYFKNDHINAIKNYKLGLGIAETWGSTKGMYANLINLSEYYLSQSKMDSFSYVFNRADKLLEGVVKDEMYYEKLASHLLLKMDALVKLEKYHDAIDLIDEVVLNYKKRFVTTRVREIAKVYHKASQLYLECGMYNSAKLAISRGFKYLIPNVDGHDLPSKNDIFLENTFTDLFKSKAEYYLKLYGFNKDKNYLDSVLMVTNLAFYANDQLHEKLVLEDSKLISIEQNKALVDIGLKALYIKKHSFNEDLNDQILYYFSKSKGLLSKEYQIKRALFNKLSSKDKNRINSFQREVAELIFQSGNSNIAKDSIFNLRLSITEKIDKILNFNKENVEQTQWIETPFIEYVFTNEYLYSYNNYEKPYFRRIDFSDNISKEITDIYDWIINVKSEKELITKLKSISSKIVPITTKDLDELVVIADGPLLTFSFDLLYFEDYFVNNSNVIYTHSPQFFTNVETDLNYHKILLLNGNPEIVESVVENGVLQYVKDEIQTISDLWGESATHINNSNDFINALSRKEFDILHFSGHAKLRNNSSMLLWGDDSSITDDQIKNWKNNFKLVTLSACETGNGTYLNGEGLKSLSKAFLDAGSNNVMNTFWSVNDKTTSKITTDFYSNLKMGVGLKNGLRDAKLKFIKNASPLVSHPYYWGALNITTNNATMMKNHKKQPKYFTIITILIFLSLLTIKLFIK